MYCNLASSVRCTSLVELLAFHSDGVINSFMTKFVTSMDWFLDDNGLRHERVNNES